MKLYEIEGLNAGDELVLKGGVRVQFVRTERVYRKPRHSTVAVVQRVEDGVVVFAHPSELRRPRPLGEHQQAVMDCLDDGRHYSFYAGCGWVYGTYTQTVRILDSLVKRGLVVRTERPSDRPGPRGTYTIVEYRRADRI